MNSESSSPVPASSPSSTPAYTRRRFLATASLAAAGVAGTAAVLAASSAEASARKVALVTGSSRGIGAATARRLAQAGFDVMVNFVVNEALAAGVVREIETTGGRARFKQADVSDAGAVKALFEATEQAFGGVDVVVANAGIMRLAPFAEMADADFDRMIAVNVRGSFNTLREAARRVRPGGRIMCLSSSITALRTATYGPYAASKMAQDMYVSALAKELRGKAISVNAVAPGVVATSLFLDGKTPEVIQRFETQTPHGRLGQPQDIAETIAMLAGPAGAWINGQTVFSNGGLV